MAASYADKLKDPRWQKKRLEIMERDGWQCQCCMSRKNHVDRFIKEQCYNGFRGLAQAAITSFIKEEDL